MLLDVYYHYYYYYAAATTRPTNTILLEAKQNGVSSVIAGSMAAVMS